MQRFPIVLFVLVLATGASAQDFQVGARTKGMGGSYTAFEDDPTSIWLNPAGIATQAGCASRTAPEDISFIFPFKERRINFEIILRVSKTPVP